MSNHANHPVKSVPRIWWWPILAGIIVGATIFPAILSLPVESEYGVSVLFWDHFDRLVPLHLLFYWNLEINSALTFMIQFSVYGTVLAYGNYRRRLLTYSLALAAFHIFCCQYCYPIAWYFRNSGLNFGYVRIILNYWPSVVAVVGVGAWIPSQYCRRKKISICSLLTCSAIVALGITLT